MNIPIRIVIADNSEEFTRPLKVYLDEQPDLNVVSVVRDGLGAVQAYQENLPDLVLIDLHLPVLDSIKTIQAIVGQNDRIKVLGTSAIKDDRYAIEAVKAGARGYVQKVKNGTANYEGITEAIRQVADDEVVLDPYLASHILQEFL